MKPNDDPYASPIAPTRPHLQDAPGDRPPLASLAQRFAGRLIDSVALVAIILGTGFALAFATMAIGMELESDDETALLGLSMFGLGGGLYFAMQTFLLVTRSQSLGKIVSGTRIHMHSDGTHAGPMATVLMRSVIPFVINALVCLFGPLDALFIFGGERRCVHDLMAGTDVRIVP